MADARSLDDTWNVANASTHADRRVANSRPIGDTVHPANASCHAGRRLAHAIRNSSQWLADA